MSVLIWRYNWHKLESFLPFSDFERGKGCVDTYLLATVEAPVSGHPREAEKVPQLELAAYGNV